MQGADRQAASIRDVARLAGVSRQTVSRVINQHPSLRPETRQRVLQVIDELNYRPNRVARALGSKRSRTIGVIAAQRAHYGPSSAIQGIESAAQERGYLVNTISLASNDPASIREALALQAEQRAEGIVIVAPQTRVLLQLAELAIDLPYVLLHARSEDEPHQLFVDQLAGARVATRHLLSLGHRQIRHLAGPQDWIEAEARLHAFAAEVSAAGLAPAPPLFGDWTADSGYDRGRELLRRRDFTAVFSANDQMALGLLHAFRDGGLQVPDEVSVVGFDDVPEAAHFSPPLTTIRQDFTELGRQCVARLVGPSDGEQPPRLEALQPLLVERASTAVPKG